MINYIYYSRFDYKFRSRKVEPVLKAKPVKNDDYKPYFYKNAREIGEYF